MVIALLAQADKAAFEICLLFSDTGTGAVEVPGDGRRIVAVPHPGVVPHVLRDGRFRGKRWCGWHASACREREKREGQGEPHGV